MKKDSPVIAIIEDFLSAKWPIQTARNRLKTPTDVAEAVQRTAIKAWEKMPVDHPNPNAWLTVTLINECHNISREENAAKRPKQLRYEPSEQNEPIAPVTEGITLDELSTAMKDMPKIQRECLLSYGAGFSRSEIMRQTGRSKPGVNKAIYRARQRLKKEFV